MIFVGKIKKGKNKGKLHIFSSPYTPTESTHGDLYLVVTGPYPSKKKAIEATNRGYR